MKIRIFHYLLIVPDHDSLVSLGRSSSESVRLLYAFRQTLSLMACLHEAIGRAIDRRGPIAARIAPCKHTCDRRGDQSARSSRGFNVNIY